MLRRIAALMLALMLCGSALASDRYVVQAGDVTALMDADGRVLLAGDDLPMLFEVRADRLYAAGTSGDYALYDRDGNPLGDLRFSMIDDMNGALIYRQDGLYGAMDADGQVLLAAEYAQLTAAGDGQYLATFTSPLDEQPDEIFRVTESGAVEATGITTDNGLRPFSGGRMPYRGPEGKYGCLDGQGRPAVPEIWAWLGDFISGAAIVSDGALYGLIDPDGNIILQPRCIWLQRCGDRLVGLREDGTAEVLSPDGAALWSVHTRSGQIEPVGGGLLVREADGCTLYGSDGAAIYTGPADILVFPGLDGQYIVSDGAWGEACQQLIGPDGSSASGRYQRILPLCAGRYAFQTFDDNYENIRCGLLTSDGAELLPAAYDDILPAGDDRLILVDGDEVVFADVMGSAAGQAF